MQLVPCNDNSNTHSDECETLIHTTAMCCPLDQLETDTWMHPSREGAAKMCKGIEYGSQLANLWLKSNPRAIFQTTEGRVKANEVEKFCFYIPDHRFRRDTYRNSRHRRAVEQFWLSIQGQVLQNSTNEAKIDINKIPIGQLRSNLEQMNNKVISIRGDSSEKQSLMQDICKYKNEVNINSIMADLHKIKTLLESKIENSQSECDKGRVPSVITDQTLLKFCTAFSTNEICSTHLVRLLFTCTPTTPILLNGSISLRFTITLKIPISEYFDAKQLFTIPLYLSTDLYKSDLNITHADKIKTVAESVPSMDDVDTLRQVLGKIMGPRRRRSIVSIYYNLELDGIPDLITQHGGDTIGFTIDKCEQRSTMTVCDYTTHDQRSINCLKSLLNTETSNVEKLCLFRMTSTESSCQVKSTNYAQLISTHDEVTIMKEGNEGIFHERPDETCYTVCAVENSDYQKIFSCGNRKYETVISKEEFEVITIVSKELNEKNILNSGMDLSKLDRTGFEMLDQFWMKHSTRHLDGMINVIMMASTRSAVSH